MVDLKREDRTPPLARVKGVGDNNCHAITSESENNKNHLSILCLLIQSYCITNVLYILSALLNFLKAKQV